MTYELKLVPNLCKVAEIQQYFDEFFEAEADFLEFNYDHPTRGLETRRVKPHRIWYGKSAYHGTAWHLSGLCPDRGALRDFDIGRIK